MTERIDADVCVIGAGHAGITAALGLSQAGKSVVILEARDRVGGRIWTKHLPDVGRCARAGDHRGTTLPRLPGWGSDQRR